MKKSTLLLWTLSLLTFNGCGDAIQGLMIYDTDVTLKTIKKVRSLPTRNAVGFEWKKIEDRHVHGVNIYRGIPSTGAQTFERIGSVGNRYATHFVDTHVKPNTTYLYTFATFSVGRESQHGAVLKVKTKPALRGVNFAKAYAMTSNVVKILWSPHPDGSINRYIIQRSVNGGEWKYVIQVQGQLRAEYIDTFVSRGNNYRYRIIAKSYDGILSQPSKITSISL